jgi:hypothetical protein
MIYNGFRRIALAHSLLPGSVPAASAAALPQPMPPADGAAETAQADALDAAEPEQDHTRSYVG